MHKKKIAFFINSLSGSGAEKVVSLLINHLSDQFEVHVILLTNEIEFELPSDKIKIFLLDHSKMISKSRLKDVLKIPFLSYQLKKYLQQNEINICFSFLVRSNFINCFLKKLGWKGVSIISERSHTSSQYGNGSFGEKMIKYLITHLYKYADLIVPNAYFTVLDLQQNFKLKNKFEVIYNPIDLAKQHETEILPIDDDVQFDQFTFIAVSRLSAQKNIRVLLNAFEKIKEKNCKLYVIGKGELEHELKQQVKELNLQDKIFFLGYKKSPSRYISQSNCFILSSNWEGFPNALLEALAAGKAVISTDCPSGPREMLYDVADLSAHCTGVEKADYGLLVPVDDVEALSNAMLTMIENEALRKLYEDKGRIRAANFDVSVVIKKYQTILEKY